MAKVKIQSSESTNFGRKVMFHEDEIEFDKLGYAEVDEKLADKLVNNYPGWIFKESAPKKEIKKNDDSVKEIAKLEEEIVRLKDIIETRESSIKVLEDEIIEWKGLVQTLKSDKEEAEFKLSEYETQSKKIVDELNLKVSLQGKTVAGLIEICNKMNLPEERFKELQKKDEIINVILEASRQ